MTCTAGYQRYVVLIDCVVYVFSEETAHRAQKVIQLADYNKFVTSVSATHLH